MIESVLDVAAPQVPWRVVHQFFDTLLHAADGNKKAAAKPAAVDQVFESAGDDDGFDVDGDLPPTDVSDPSSAGEQPNDADVPLSGGGERGAWIVDRVAWEWLALDRRQTPVENVGVQALACGANGRHDITPRREIQRLNPAISASARTHHESCAMATSTWCPKSLPRFSPPGLPWSGNVH